ncbi:MAG: hypothetical protein EOP09_03920 [Proteobacteria bacterium]|nr:MAG: hypothetical protein EOP09_03920 [Pseudomonadota bacterium]
MGFSLPTRSALAVLSLSFLCSCPNVFDPLSNPSGDAQILSAARAAFDAGDLAQAREYYGQLGNSDVAESELAFTYLNEAGVTMSALVSAVKISDGQSVGSILTTLTESLIPGAGQARRGLLEQSFAKVAQIETPALRGFTRFITSISIAASVLAEHRLAQSNGILEGTDLLANKTACSNVTACTVGDADCAEPTPTVFIAGTDDSTHYKSTTNTNINLNTSSPSYWMFVNSLQAAQTGLNEMGVNSGDSLTLVNQILGISFTTASAQQIQCLRASLVLQLGVGR